MNTKWISVLTTASILLFSSHALAGLISYKGYTLDEDKNIVTGAGLEWLQWDFTKGMSIDHALNLVAGTYDGGGWRLASNADMSVLFNTFVLGANFIWDSNESTSQTSLNGNGDIEDINSDPELQFIELFGVTLMDNSDPANINLHFSSAAFFGENFNSGSLYNLARVEDDFAGDSPGQGRLDFSGGSSIYENIYSPLVSSDGTGIALIRSIHTQIPSVSEPRLTTLLLFGLLILLVKNYFKNSFVSGNS